MRAFHFQPIRSFHRPADGPGTGPAESPWGSAPVLAGALALGCALLFGFSSAHAQWPGEIHGQAVDAVTGTGIPGAVVELAGAGRTVRTDPAGRFRIRSLDPGTYTIHATALGYGETESELEVANGVVSQVLLELPPRALEVTGVRVEGATAQEPGVHRLDRTAVQTSGARSAAELLQDLAGVTVVERGPGAPATASIRGSSADAVLVLVDGIPLNDPITGEADLSALPTSIIQEVTVLPGARTARYGPRAQAGVILVETRSARPGAEARVSGGSLGLIEGEGEAGFRAGELELGAGGGWLARDGSFSFQQPAEVGGGTDRRRNADLEQRIIRGSGALEVAGGELRSRMQWEALERGLPGIGFAPSLHARQELTRTRWSGSWTRPVPRGTLRISTSTVVQKAGHTDPAPPFGLPYADTTRLRHVSLHAELDRMLDLGPGALRLSGGVEGDHQRLRTQALAESAPQSRSDVGLWAATSLSWPGAPGTPEVGGTARIHRDGLLDEQVPTHELTFAYHPGPFTLRVAHRSGYSPPTLGDQFFRDGVAVRPNPELEAERIPGEWEASILVRTTWRDVQFSSRATAYQGDVEGMIVWSPDFRFVWSPRNVDVNRRGAEFEGRVTHPPSGLHLQGSYSLARATYDRPGSPTVQIVYRPRHSGSLETGWAPAPGWNLRVTGRYLGTRYPVPARLNALPPFWSLNGGVRGRLSLGDWRVEPALWVQRIRNRTDSFIFGFPEPGRRWTVEFTVRPRMPVPR